jgi:hypothetical protein
MENGLENVVLAVVVYGNFTFEELSLHTRKRVETPNVKICALDICFHETWRLKCRNKMANFWKNLRRLIWMKFSGYMY